MTSRTHPIGKWALIVVLICVAVSAAGYITAIANFDDDPNSGSEDVMGVAIRALLLCAPVLLVAIVLAIVSLARERRNVPAIVALVLGVPLFATIGPMFVQNFELLQFLIPR